MQFVLLQALWEPLVADPRFRHLVLMTASTLAALLVTALPQHPFLSYTIAQACIGLVSSAFPCTLHYHQAMCCNVLNCHCGLKNILLHLRHTKQVLCSAW